MFKFKKFCNNVKMLKTLSEFFHYFLNFKYLKFIFTYNFTLILIIFCLKRHFNGK